MFASSSSSSSRASSGPIDLLSMMQKHPSKRGAEEVPFEAAEKIVDFSVLKALRVPKRMQNPAEILRRVSPDSKEFKTEIERQLRASFLSREQERQFRVQEAFMIENYALNEEYRAKRAEMREAAAAAEAEAAVFSGAGGPVTMETANDDSAGTGAAAASTSGPTEQLAYLAVATEAEARAIAERGVAKGNLPDSRLATGESGVSLCQYVDRTCPKRGLQPAGWLLVLRYLRCRVCRWAEGDSVAEPQPQFDCHVSRRGRADGLEQLPLPDAFHSSQVFLFEYSEDFDLLDRPRQAVPVAAVRYEFSGRIVASQQQQQQQAQQSKPDSMQQQSASSANNPNKVDRSKSGMLHQPSRSSGPGRLPFVASRQGGGTLVGQLSLGLELPGLASLYLDLVSLEAVPFVFPCLQQDGGNLQVRFIEFDDLLSSLSGFKIRGSREVTAAAGPIDSESSAAAAAGHVSYLVGLATPDSTHPLARLCNQLVLSRRALLCSLTSASSGRDGRLPLCYLVPSDSRPAERLNLDRLARKLSDPGRHQLHVIVWLPLPRSDCFFDYSRLDQWHRLPQPHGGVGAYWAAECRSDRRGCYATYSTAADRIGHLARQAAGQRRDLQARVGMPGLVYLPLKELLPKPSTSNLKPTDDNSVDEQRRRSPIEAIHSPTPPPANVNDDDDLSLPPPDKLVFDEPPDSPDDDVDAYSGEESKDNNVDNACQSPISYHDNLLLDLPVLPDQKPAAPATAAAASASAGTGNTSTSSIKRRFTSDAADIDDRKRPRPLPSQPPPPPLQQQKQQTQQFISKLKQQISNLRDNVERQRLLKLNDLTSPASPQTTSSPPPQPPQSATVPQKVASILPPPESLIAAAATARDPTQPSPMSPSPPSTPPPLRLLEAPASPSPPQAASPPCSAVAETDIDERRSALPFQRNAESVPFDQLVEQPAKRPIKRASIDLEDDSINPEESLWRRPRHCHDGSLGDVDERWHQPLLLSSASAASSNQDVDMRRMAPPSSTNINSASRRVNPLPHPSSLPPPPKKLSASPPSLSPPPPPPPPPQRPPATLLNNRSALFARQHPHPASSNRSIANLSNNNSSRNGPPPPPLPYSNRLPSNRPPPRPFQQQRPASTSTTASRMNGNVGAARFRSPPSPTQRGGGVSGSRGGRDGSGAYGGFGGIQSRQFYDRRF
ncbi:hypothetical protein BOX15_Mlig032711g2 [Macrostomum lignano]|uniref:TASOR pseudo-PARP domain-containing protein n=1 Tax=Macrostomum lignano TaxID=282301 RepID=A0A267H704_9PLAT|nr:hypothetical protein BOX15_Mlig032711g2 [Macrostomum lignano]